MKRAMLGALVTGLVMVAAGAVGYPQVVSAQRAPVGESAGESGLVALSGPANEQSQMVTVLDARNRAMAVYRVDAASGKIKLLSVRNIHWDLQMLQLNSENPLPQEIRSLLEQK
jgi:hypothetical protein